DQVPGIRREVARVAHHDLGLPGEVVAVVAMEHGHSFLGEGAAACFRMAPQAMRLPAFPEGSVISSSGSSWITRQVPLPGSSEFFPLPSVTRVATQSIAALPSAFAVKFGRSPACGPSLFCAPCLR